MKDDRLLVDHILEATALIIEYTKGFDETKIS